MTRKAQIEGAAKPAAKPKATLGDVLSEYIAANPEKWEAMKLWPAQSAFVEIVKQSK